jgi:hypothetical protein
MSKCLMGRVEERCRPASRGEAGDEGKKFLRPGPTLKMSALGGKTDIPDPLVNVR